MKKLLLVLLCIATTLHGARDRRNRYGDHLSFYSEYKEATERKKNPAYKLIELYKADRAAYHTEHKALLRKHLGSGPGMLPLKFIINFGHLRLTHFVRMKRLGWKFKKTKVKDSPLIPVTTETMPRLAHAIKEISLKFGFTKPVTAFITDQPFYLAATAGPLRDYGVLIMSPADLYCPDDEAVLNTIGHELGHIHHRHVHYGAGSLMVLYIAVLVALTKLRDKVLPHDRRLLNTILEWIVPLSSMGAAWALSKPLSRFAERQADAAAARVTNPRYGVKAFQYFNDKPDTRHAFWRYFDSHPSHEERVKFFKSQIPVWDAAQKAT